MEGELCPRAGAACSLCFCPPLPLGALQETQQGSNRLKGPHGFQGSPAQVLETPRGSASQASSPATVWGCSLA